MATQPFDWCAYFLLARELAERQDEASLRSALSRAYYYIYHLALQRALKMASQYVQVRAAPIYSCGATTAEALYPIVRNLP